MQKADYTNTSIYKHSEYRAGLALMGCQGLRVSDVTISVHAQPPFKCDQETQVTSSTSPNPQPEIPNPNPEIPNPNADAARSKGDRFPQTATYTLTPNL